MGFEDPKFIHEFVETNPASSDKVAKGDDHVRGIKKALWGTGSGGSDGTFKEFTGPITLTDTEINNLPTDIAAVQTDLNDHVTEIREHIVPVGTIMMWSGLNGSIPSGWGLCDGTNYTNNASNSVPSPDLRDKFIVGAGAAYTVDESFAGTGNTGSAGAHDHGGSTGAHALTVAELPDLSTALQLKVDSSGQGDDHNETGYIARGRTSEGPGAWTADPVRVDGANGNAHTHSLAQEPAHSHTQELPPYYALSFIIKVDEYIDPSP